MFGVRLVSYGGRLVMGLGTSQQLRVRQAANIEAPPPQKKRTRFVMRRMRCAVATLGSVATPQVLSC